MKKLLISSAFIFLYTICIAQEKVIQIDYNNTQSNKPVSGDKNDLTINFINITNPDINITDGQNPIVDNNGKPISDFKAILKSVGGKISLVIKNGAFVAPFLSGDIKGPLAFTYHNKKNIFTISLSEGTSGQPNKIIPILAPANFDILGGTKFSKNAGTALIASPDLKVFTPESIVFDPKENYSLINSHLIHSKDYTNELVYSFCDNKLYYKNYNNHHKKFKPNVNEGLSFELNTVPNPLKYDIKIKSEYKSYNTETDSLLETFLLNPSNSIAGLAKANAATINDLKKEVLGYLQKINTQLTAYMDKYLSSFECINSSDFMSDKQIIENNINASLSKEGITAPTKFDYPGNLLEFISNIFDKEDSASVAPVIKSYQQFKAFNVTAIKYQIPKLQNEDELLIHLTIKPKENSGAGLMIDSMDINIPLFGGFKVDVSPGLFYTYFNSDKFSLFADSTTANGVVNRFQTIIPESRKKGDFGVSTLIHFYSRWGKDVNIAGSIGVGLTLEDKPQIRYFTGISILVGRINRIALSSGLAWGEIEKLSDKYFKSDGTFRQINFSDTKLDTKKSFENSWYLSLSYNVPLLKRKSK